MQRGPATNNNNNNKQICQDMPVWIGMSGMCIVGTKALQISTGHISVRLLLWLPYIVAGISNPWIH